MAQCRVWNDFAWEMYGEYNDFMSPAARHHDVRGCAGDRGNQAGCENRISGPDASVQAGLRRPRLAASQLQFDRLRSDVGGDPGLQSADHVPRLNRTRSTRGAQGRRRGDQLRIAFAVADYRAGRELVRLRRAREISEIRFAAVESGIGWVPWALDAMDEAYRKHHLWAYPQAQARCPANISAATGPRRFRKIAPGLISRRNVIWSTTSCGPMTIRTPKEPGRTRRKRSSARWVISVTMRARRSSDSMRRGCSSSMSSCYSSGAAAYWRLYSTRRSAAGTEGI